MTHTSAQVISENLDQKFSDLDISPQLKKGIKDLGYITPTEFQRSVFESFSQGKHIAGSGSSYGKALAFSLPILSKIDEKTSHSQALIIGQGSLQGELWIKECKNLGRHLEIEVGNLGNIDPQADSAPQILVTSVDDLLKIDGDQIFSSLHTVFFDDLSKEDSEKALAKLGSVFKRDVQVLIFGDHVYQAFKDGQKDLIEEAALIANSDQPKIALAAKHICHQSKDEEPKAKSLLAALEFHKPKSTLVTCGEAQECQLLATYLSRYGYKTSAISEENGRSRLRFALNDLGKGNDEVLLCQQSLLGEQRLENIAFMINYDMFDRPQAYEQTTHFDHQAPGLQRVIVSLLSTRELGYLAPIQAQCLIEFEEVALPSDEETLDLCAQRIVANLNREASLLELGQFEPLAQRIFSDKKALPSLALLLKKEMLSSTKVQKSRPLSQADRRNDRPSDRKQDRSEREDGRRARPDRQEGEERPNRSAQDDAPSGVTRLYVTLGRRDDFADLAGLAQYLSEKSGVDLGHFSGSGMVRDNSAHIEVDDEVAEAIISAIHDSPRPSSESAEGEEADTIVCERARRSPPRPGRRPMQRRRPYSPRRN